MEPIVTLSDQHIAHLNREFNKEEVEEAMKIMTALTSPGTDGIPPVFLQKEWPTCRNDISKATLDFLKGGLMLKETNKTHIALIPKVERPDQVSQFRPINLCNSTYK